MIKHIIIFLIFSIIMQAFAMEIQPKIDGKKNCYLARMPLDVQDLILFFVKDNETAGEFLARLQCFTRPGIEYNKFVFQENTISRLICRLFPASTKTLREFCPDRTNLAILKLNPNGYFPSLTIINLEKNQTILIDEKIDKGDYHAIALSRGAHMIALLEHRIEWYGMIAPTLVIKNIVTKKKWEYKIDGIYGQRLFPPIVFNKQNTHVMVPRKEKGRASLAPIHTKAKKVNELLTIEDFTQKTPFQRYLIDRRVCKSLEYNK